MKAGTLEFEVKTENVDLLIEKLKLADEMINELTNELNQLDQYTKAVNDECFYDVGDVMRLTGYSKAGSLGNVQPQGLPDMYGWEKKNNQKIGFLEAFR